MLNNKEKELIDELRRDTQESIIYFSNKNKKERERAICRAFLRCLGIIFMECDIISDSNEPTDVKFQNAEFQIKELQDKDRKRHAEYKESYKKYKRVSTVKELFEEYTHQEISLQEVCNQLTDFLKKYANKLGKKMCNNLDLLVYVNLKDKELEYNNGVIEYSNIAKQGWRSVSMIMNRCSYIFYANDNATEFLKKNQQQLKHEFDGLELWKN